MQLLLFCSVQQIDGQNMFLHADVRLKCASYSLLSHSTFFAWLHYSHSSSSGRDLLMWFIAEICMMPRTLIENLELSLSLCDCLSFATNISAYFAKDVYLWII